MSNLRNRVDRLSTKTYEKLGPKERVKLLLLRAAEGNEEEASRVDGACPVRAYRMCDADYVELMDSARQLAREGKALICWHRRMLLVLELQAREHYVQALLLDERPRTGKGNSEGERDPEDVPTWARAARNILEVEMRLGPHIEQVREAAREPLLIQLSWQWQGFDRCCREHIGLDGKTFLKAYGGAALLGWLETLEPELEELATGEGDQEGITHFENYYGALFRGDEKSGGQDA